MHGKVTVPNTSNLAHPRNNNWRTDWFPLEQSFHEQRLLEQQFLCNTLREIVFLGTIVSGTTFKGPTLNATSFGEVLSE